MLPSKTAYVDFDNPTTTSKTKKQKKQTKTPLDENDPYCKASTTIRHGRKKPY
jgi:hypothetical protein